jgi:hypothetical protein
MIIPINPNNGEGSVDGDGRAEYVIFRRVAGGEFRLLDPTVPIAYEDIRRP